MHSQIIFSVAELFTMFGIGAIACHLGYIKDKDLDNWPKLIIDILFPMLIFSSIVKDLNPEKLDELWLLPCIGFGLILLGAIAGYPLKRLMKSKNPDTVNTFHHFCAINNYAFLPMIIVTNIYGQSYLPLVFLLNIGSTIGVWSIGIALLGETNINKTIRNIFSINILAVFLAVVISLCKLKGYIPSFVMITFSKLGACAIPFILMTIGATLYSSRSMLMRNKRDVLYLSAVRLVIIPLLSIVVLKALPLPEKIENIAFIVAIMPVAVSSSVLTRRYGGSPEFAGQASLATTLLSVITIPLIIYLFM